MNPNQELPLADGCVYVTGIGHKGKVPFKIFCHKMTLPESQYCPMHKLFIEDEGKEPERRRLARRLKKEQRAAELDALALSPLRADNPGFEKGKLANTGYQEEGVKNPNPERKCWHLNVKDGECQDCGAWG